MQQTLANTIELSGIGVHSGAIVTLRLYPAAANTGIVFKRIDVAENNVIPASYKNVADTRMCTLLRNEQGVVVSTVEHVMSALRGAAIDNAIVEVNAEEIPIMDGSSIEFLRQISRAGVQEQDAPRKVIRVLKKVEVTGDKDEYVSIEPHDGLAIDYTIDFTHPAIGKQELSFEYTPEFYQDNVSSARTFGFVEDLEKLKAMGLAKGASEDNAVGIGKEGVVNAGGLRFPDEFVRHKVLDCIGDLYLAGMQIYGRVHAVKAGHAMHLKLLQQLFSDPAQYEVVAAA